MSRSSEWIVFQFLLLLCKTSIGVPMAARMEQGLRRMPSTGPVWKEEFAMTDILRSSFNVGMAPTYDHLPNKSRKRKSIGTLSRLLSRYWATPPTHFPNSGVHRKAIKSPSRHFVPELRRLFYSSPTAPSRPFAMRLRWG